MRTVEDTENTIVVGGEIFELVGEGENAFVKGLYGNRYQDACWREQQAHKDDPCPAELQETRTLEYKGWKCKVYFNYVPPYGIGRIPCNAWMAYAEGTVNGEGYNWDCALKKEVKTLDEACDAIRPSFEMAVDRTERKQ